MNKEWAKVAARKERSKWHWRKAGELGEQWGKRDNKKEDLTSATSNPECFANEFQTKFRKAEERRTRKGGEESLGFKGNRQISEVGKKQKTRRKEQVKITHEHRIE